jgi:hypothetical protein
MIRNNDLIVSTWDLSKGFGVEHRQLKRFVEIYRPEFEEFGVIAHMRIKSTEKKGRPVKEYLLNEEQATYLTMLMKNNDRVRQFKKFLNKEFFKYRKILTSLIVQRQNAEWLEKRAQGKIERRFETDSIKEFVEYAIAQGSTHAQKYYILISKMENKALFAIELLEHEYPNIRDLLDGSQLATMQNADKIVARALKEGMKKQMPYKDIYLMAKERIERFAELVGRSPLQYALSANPLPELT